MDSNTDPVVLVVDDKPEVRQVLLDMLKALGIVAQGLGSGEAALEVLRSGPVALVLLDLAMPNLSGEGVVECLHRDQIDVPIIFITGLAVSSVKAHLLQGGACRCVLAKPFRLVELKAALDACCWR